MAATASVRICAGTVLERCENGCTIPSCETATIGIPGGFEHAQVTIDYTYDPLYRLTAADYSTGDSYAYTFDAVGNRLAQESMVGGLSSVVSYQYDIANRLTDQNGVPYNWDANGNVLADGNNTYTYDSANRLTSVLGPSSSAQYTYNGLGDRVNQTVDGVQTNFLLDLNSGLTQVLSDSTTSYAYGIGRISQQSGNTQSISSAMHWDRYANLQTRLVRSHTRRLIVHMA